MVAHIQPLVISLTFVIGYLFFSENITVNKVIGVSLVILGIIFLNKKKYRNRDGRNPYFKKKMAGFLVWFMTSFYKQKKNISLYRHDNFTSRDVKFY